MRTVLFVTHAALSALVIHVECTYLTWFDYQITLSVNFTQVLMTLATKVQCISIGHWMHRSAVYLRKYRCTWQIIILHSNICNLVAFLNRKQEIQILLNFWKLYFGSVKYFLLQQRNQWNDKTKKMKWCIFLFVFITSYSIWQNICYYVT